MMGPGPLEEGIHTAYPTAHMHNTPDPLNQDPGLVRLARRSSQSEWEARRLDFGDADVAADISRGTCPLNAGLAFACSDSLQPIS